MRKILYALTPAVAAVLIMAALLPAITQKSVADSATQIKHLVVIFQENVSYDHYFATYPNATNPANEPQFTAAPDTPSGNGLTQGLIQSNPNTAKPFRLDRTQAITCDMNHDYTPEQKAYHGGMLDKFVQFTGNNGAGCNADNSTVMGYYDGNTVTAMWNYAQHFAMSDNSFSSTFGPSTPGMLNLVAGQTHGATPANIPDVVANGSVIGDPDGAHDDCSGKTTVSMSGKNVGDLLNAKGVTWGWFQGGFKPSSVTGTGTAVCKSWHLNIGGANVTDYSAHHEPFQYYASTSNPHRLPPTSVSMIGKTDQANHQYDLSDFWNAVNSGNMPAVSFLKAAKYQDGHAGYSDPLDEQTFLVNTINQLQKTPQWSSTAVIVMYDDSDGWYDHVMPPHVSPSSDPVYDALAGADLCGKAPAGAYQDRCGYGPRQPLLVISPFAKHNFIDHQVTDISSVLRFIEDNWNLGRIGDQSFDANAGTLANMFNFGDHENSGPLFLDPSTGQVLQSNSQGNNNQGNNNQQ